MSTTYECRIRSADGATLLASVANFVTPIDGGGAALSYALNVGQVGALELTVPASFDPALLPLDGRISVWRSINGRTPQQDGEAVFLIRKWLYTEMTTTVIALHANHLLTRRILAYYAGSSYTSKTVATPAGNLVKTFVSENMLSGIVGADRIGAETQADISAYLANQANLGDGVSLAASVAWRSLFDVVRELCDASTQAGTYLTSEIVAPTETTLELRTYASQRGTDHRASTASPVIFSPDRGNLENVRLEVDRSEEVTVAIVGGAGEKGARLTASSIDTTRIAESPFNRIEQFGDYSNVEDAAALQDIADALVRAGRSRVTFEADLVDTDGTTRGIHYDLGDMVTGAFRGQQYDVRLDVIGVSVSAEGQRTQAQLRSVT